MPIWSNTITTMETHIHKINERFFKNANITLHQSLSIRLSTVVKHAGNYWERNFFFVWFTVIVGIEEINFINLNNDIKSDQIRSKCFVGQLFYLNWVCFSICNRSKRHQFYRYEKSNNALFSRSGCFFFYSFKTLNEITNIAIE